MSPTTVASRRLLNLRDEAFLLLERGGAILETAREISRCLRDRGITGAIIGGVAVVLHGHHRTTTDIDIAVDGPLAAAASALEAIGFVKDPSLGQLLRDGLPVHLLSIEAIGIDLGEIIEIEGVSTVTLPNLIAMKLLSGTRNMLRAKDIGDVIDLIRARRLTSSLAAALPPEFVLPTEGSLRRSIRTSRNILFDAKYGYRSGDYRTTVLACRMLRYARRHAIFRAIRRKDVA